MHRFHFTRTLRTLLFLAVLGSFMAGSGLLWWVNRTGLPESWRSYIEQEAEKKGAYLKIGSLRLSLLQGVIATDVHVFNESERLQEISRLESIVLSFDPAKIARGIVELTKVQLNHANLDLPLDPKNAQGGQVLHITDASGTVFMPGERRLELRDATGNVAGIQLKLDAKIIFPRGDDKKPPKQNSLDYPRALTAKILTELEKWRFDAARPPILKISLDGDLNDHSTLTAKLDLDCERVEKNDYLLRQVRAEASLAQEIITVSSLTARDTSGPFSAHADFDMTHNAGRFDVSSGLEIPALFSSWLNLPRPKDIKTRGKQILEASGNFELDEHGTPTIHMTGRGRCEALSFRGVAFDSIESNFSWQENKLLLRDLHILRKDGRADGKVLLSWPNPKKGPLGQLEIRSTLTLPIYRQLVTGWTPKLPLEVILENFAELEKPNIDLNAVGSFDSNNHEIWSYKGSGIAKNISYHGVPVNSAQCQYDLNHQKQDFYDGTVDFNYTNYPLRKSFNGPASAIAKVGRIRFDNIQKTVAVESVRGAIWAAPVVRLFAPKVADSLEIYRFHQPPEMLANGLVDVTPQGRTALEIDFRAAPGQLADYEFLGENLTLREPSGHVSLRGEKVLIRDLKLQGFGGPVTGKIDYLGAGKLQGDLNWTQLTFADIAQTYGFEIKGSGTTTGRLEFSITNGKVSTLDGEGLIALETDELFSVPVFGPLSSLIGGVLNDKTAGTQLAKNAFCTFKISNGILRSQDFQTRTTSLSMVGDGSVDLNDRTLDMTMRLNTRGFLGFITLPLRPFSGLFQFHGTGPLKDTNWVSTPFSPAPEAQNKLLLSPPPKATAVE